jgi:hypothetical protein
MAHRPLYTIAKAVEALNARVVGQRFTEKSLRHLIHRGELGRFTVMLGRRRYVDVEGWLDAGSPKAEGPRARGPEVGLSDLPVQFAVRGLRRSA